AQEDLLQRDRRGLRVAEQERLLVRQEGTVLGAAPDAKDAHRIAYARHQRRQALEAMLGFRQDERLAATGLDDRTARGVQERQDLADQRRLTLAARVKLPALVPQQHQRAVAPEALHGVLEHLFREDTGLESLQRHFADARDSLYAGLPPRQLLRQ